MNRIYKQHEALLKIWCNNQIVDISNHKPLHFSKLIEIENFITENILTKDFVEKYNNNGKLIFESYILQFDNNLKNITNIKLKTKFI